MEKQEIFTIGHSTRGFDELVRSLEAWRIEILADVRTAPRSRRNPQFNTEALARDLPPRGIGYVRFAELGGWRKPAPDSQNTAWRNDAFRGFADYMQTPEFDTALRRLLELGRTNRLAFMCAESVPWRCHRSLIADALTSRGCLVRHIMSATKAEPHRMTPFARVEGDRVTYPAMI